MALFIYFSVEETPTLNKLYEQTPHTASWVRVSFLTSRKKKQLHISMQLFLFTCSSLIRT